MKKSETDILGEGKLPTGDRYTLEIIENIYWLDIYLPLKKRYGAIWSHDLRLFVEEAIGMEVEFVSAGMFDGMVSFGFKRVEK